MPDFLTPELVNIVMAERLKDAGSIRVSRELGTGAARERVRSRLAATLAGAAAVLHPEAARAAVGLRRVPMVRECDRSPPCSLSLCLCDE